MKLKKKKKASLLPSKSDAFFFLEKVTFETKVTMKQKRNLGRLLKMGNTVAWTET